MHDNPLAAVQPLRWSGNTLAVLDQRVLPARELWRECGDADAVFHAIRNMEVRGAPAIGIAAAYGVVLAAREAIESPDWSDRIRAAIEHLRQSRPTAVNLFWALDRMAAVLGDQSDSTAVSALEAEAIAIHREDEQANRAMGEAACDHMLAGGTEPFAVLTHCNTGALATGGYGTALGAIRSLWARGGLTRVYADETRPWLQGSRLTAWELQREGLPVVLNADGAAAHILKQGEVKWIVVGADRITANGDVANKIGTYGLAVLARHHGVGFMVVAPSSTVDMATPDGEAIEIEQRQPEELCTLAGTRIAPEGVDAFNPVFDVTPADLVDVIVTEKGVVKAPDSGSMAAIFGQGNP